jgi:hypothetical protein
MYTVWIFASTLEEETGGFPGNSSKDMKMLGTML